MGDHLALLVNRLLTESTLEEAIGCGKHGEIDTNLSSLNDEAKEFSRKRNARDGTSLGQLVECRICQEEEEDCNMEIPCSCSGSLKYAHRKCIQRWCNEKGDTICEICLQQFQPGYTAPPGLFDYETMPMNFRGNWRITRQGLHDSQIITLVQLERDILHYHHDDHSALSMIRTVFSHTVALIFMVLLFLHQLLPVIIGEADQNSFTFFLQLVLRMAGSLLLLFLMIRTLRTFHQRRQHQGTQEITERAQGENLAHSWHVVHISSSDPHPSAPTLNSRE